MKTRKAGKFISIIKVKSIFVSIETVDLEIQATEAKAISICNETLIAQFLNVFVSKLFKLKLKNMFR